MRFDKVSGADVGTFRGPFELDLTRIPGLLIAITGKNGAGKSTLCEMLAGSLYRETPTRGSLVGLARSREAFIETEVTNGVSHRIRHTLDAVSGKSEAFVTDAAGAPRYKSTKVSAYDIWAKEHLPAEEELYASIFSPQGSGGLLAMTEGARKAVLLRVLGVERLEKMAEKARARATEARTLLVTLDARLADERRRGGDVAKLEEERTRALEAAAGIVGELAKASQAVEAARAALANGEQAAQAARLYASRLAELKAGHAPLKERVRELEKRLDNNRAVLDRSVAIRAAVARATAIKDRVDAIATEYAEKESTFLAQSQALRSSQEKVSRLRAQRTEALARRDRAQARRQGEESVAVAERELPVRKADLDLLETTLKLAETELAEGRALQLGGANKRIDRLRVGHEQDLLVDLDAYDEYQPLVVAMLEGAQSALMDDDALAATLTELPAKLLETEQRRKSTADTIRTLRASLSQLTAAAAQRAAVEAAREEMAAGEAEASRLLDEVVVALEAMPNELAIDGLSSALHLLRQERKSLLDEAATVAELAKLATPLAQAEARVAELEPQLAEARDAIDTSREAIDKLGPELTAPSLDGLRQDLKLAESAAKSLAESLAERRTAVTRLDVALETARASAAIVAELEAERGPVVEALEDWKKLGDDLGRDGLQALEIDAAGPELSALTNDLLHNCFGPRFTMTVEATRLSADGKRMLEGLEIRVLDLKEGREAGGETFSGGERVILSEALALALTVLGCRRAGVTEPTLVRDESGAHLDDDNGRSYIAMLRRAAEMIGASKVLFVSHSKEAQALADARVHIEDGKITVSP